MKPSRLVLRVLFCSWLTALVISEISALAVPQAPAVSGAEVYQKRCAACHDKADTGAPSREALQKLTAKHILRSLDFGIMLGISGPMKRPEREAVANFLGTGATE